MLKPVAASLEPGAVRGASSDRWAFAALALTMLLSSLGTSIANVGLPTLALAFGASFQQVQWVVLAYLLAVTTLVVSAGRLGDLVGRRQLLLAGLSLFTLASVACGVAPTLGFLVAARAAQGAGAAVMMALTMALAADTAAKGKTGTAMGMLGALSAAGTALGPPLGGALIAWLGWQAIFLAQVPLGLLAMALTSRCLPADQETAARAAGFDHAGTLLLFLSLMAYASSMTIGRGSFGLLNASLLVAAVAGAALFVRTERRAASPLVPLAVFRDALLGPRFLASALATTVVMASLVVGPFYLAGALGLDAVGVGLVMSVGPLAAAFAGGPAGRIVDRFGAARAAIAGLALMAAGCTALAVAPASFGLAGYVGPLVVTTSAYALFQAANNTAIMTNVAAAQRGVISGVLGLSRNLGLVTGASVMAMVFALGSSMSDQSPVEMGMRVTFGVAAVLVIAALAVGFAGAKQAASSTGAETPPPAPPRPPAQA